MLESENTSTYHEPAKEIPILAEYDVVVCGGGPSGCAAAIAAARRGAKTLLIEKDGYLGGATVSQLVVVILSTNGVDFQGIWHEYAHNLKERNAIRGLTKTDGLHQQIRGSVDPEMVKYVWDDLCTESGVELLHHVYGTTAIVEADTAKGVIVETKAGRQAILAKRVIDATGDGIVAAQSGVGWDQGDGEHAYAMALTKVFRMANVNKPEPWPNDDSMRKLESELTTAIERGEYDTPVITEKRRILGYIRGWLWALPNKRPEIMSVISRVLEVNPIDSFDLTRAEREGREQAHQAADFYCCYVPGFENAYLLDTSNHIGIRSSRRLHGIATVIFDDAWNLRKYPDSIARSSWDIDVWPADSYSKPAVPRGENDYQERMAKIAAGDYFDIRYGCIVAEGVDNLLTNCRALYDHIRNLTDAQIKALASHGGVIGIQFLKLILAELTLENYLRHIDHACELVGPEHVSIAPHGFDLTFMQVFGNAHRKSIPDGPHNDGSAYYEGLMQLIQGLEKRGYVQKEIAGILGKNLLRVLAQSLY